MRLRRFRVDVFLQRRFLNDPFRLKKQIFREAVLNETTATAMKKPKPITTSKPIGKRPLGKPNARCEDVVKKKPSDYFSRTYKS